MIDKALDRKAVIAALKTRQDAGVDDETPICPYDFALNGGAAVRFVAGSSLEGMYERQSETIIVSSLRPRGRRAFTCAHEYGHHIFGHGTHIDELPEERKGPRPHEELLADRFAGLLMMPRLAVLTGFKKRGIRPECCTPEQAYALSCWLGVSYEAFLTHASASVGIMPAPVADVLKKVSPKSIKAKLAPTVFGEDLVVVDKHWTHAIDLAIGEIAMLPPSSIIEGSVVTLDCELSDAVYVRAASRGIGRAVCGEWAVHIRVMPAEYTGLARCRHLPEESDD
jgi:Zn-dependent peptidase ImmA (M78 family)